MEADLQEIIKASAMNPLKIRNVYVYGSRVYGTANEYSDYDVQIVGMSLLARQELKLPKYNIHIHTHDVFKQDLMNHDPHCIECVYAPQNCVLQEKQNFGFILDKNKMIPAYLQKSHDSWNKAKQKFLERDLLRGRKGIFHSIRILYFGNQLKREGKITDWTQANYLWEEIKDSKEFRWDVFKKAYLPLKIKLEGELTE